jgi:hypothetical protein
VLTEKGADLIPAFMVWGDGWTAEDSGPPLRPFHHACRHDTEPTVSCSQCGESIGYRDVVARVGPGARVAPGTSVIADRLR